MLQAKNISLPAKRFDRDFFKSIAVYLILIAMLLLAELFSPGYLKLSHMIGILRISSFMGIAAIGQTFAILTGGIDLSIANTISFSYIIAAQVMMGQNQNVLPALGEALLLGLVVGLINGTSVCFLNIPPFIMTLGVSSVIQGAYMIFTQGAPKGNTAPIVSDISNKSLFGAVSGVVLIWLLLAVLSILVLKRTPFGRRIYSVGSNPVASKFSGINTKWVICSVYILSAVVASLTGFLLIGYTGTSYLDAGAKYSTSIIAAVVIGGTAITGGKGGYMGTMAGAVIMTVLEDFLNIISIPQAGRQIIEGVLILILILIYGREKIKKA